MSFANATAYTSCRLVFPTLKDVPADNSMQIAGLQFFTVPEPGTAGLAALALLGCFRRRR